MGYTLEHDPIEAGHLIAITGELDIAATPELSTVLLIAAGSPGSLVVLDLAEVDFIDSTGLGTLLRAGDEIESAGKRLRVVCADGPVRSLLELTNLTNRFQLCPSRDDAFAAA
ncbi:MAG TPA: STAS domain-containing protein [Solirubrobacteraceae bacterium]|jgi:anti-sigma B factor antagonist|nr:STAS domain-containing protein [Solirubrobacteraceae bacterium]